MNNIQVPPMIPLEELKKKRKGNIATGISKTMRSVKRSKDQEKKSRAYKLKGIEGQYANAVFPVDSEIVMGRSREGVHIIYPSDTPGISRKHCSIRPTEEGDLLLKDLGSTQGTYFADGTRLEAGVSYRINRGECFYLASKHETYKVM